MTIEQILKQESNELIKSEISEPNLKSKLLLMSIMNVSKEYLVIHGKDIIDSTVQEEFKNLISKLKMGYPLEYITHEKEFMKLKFYVDENVLIPRADTEVLVEEVIKRINKQVKVLDLCTGSGAIAISLAKYLENSFITAIDISAKAIEIAQKNAKQNNVEIEFVCSDLFEKIESSNTKFDIIVSNPPYIETDEILKLNKDVQKEPILALDGGKDGVIFYKKISNEAKEFLKENGIIAFEIGYKQKNDVIQILQNEGYKNIICIKDLSGNDRVVLANI